MCIRDSIPTLTATGTRTYGIWSITDYLVTYTSYATGHVVTFEGVYAVVDGHEPEPPWELLSFACK